MPCQEVHEDWKLCLDCLQNLATGAELRETHTAILYCPRCGEVVLEDSIPARYQGVSRAPFHMPCLRCIRRMMKKGDRTWMTR